MSHLPLTRFYHHQTNALAPRPTLCPPCATPISKAPLFTHDFPFPGSGWSTPFRDKQSRQPLLVSTYLRPSLCPDFAST